MTTSDKEQRTAEKVTCRVMGCHEPTVEGWRLCKKHLEDIETKCPHGNPTKFCVECTLEFLRSPPSIDYTLPQGDLLALTYALDEHPEWWDHPCFCAECRSCV